MTATYWTRPTGAVDVLYDVRRATDPGQEAALAEMGYTQVTEAVAVDRFNHSIDPEVLLNPEHIEHGDASAESILEYVGRHLDGTPIWVPKPER